MNPSQLICPKCGQPDQIQKVTSVYGGNTKEWSESHGSGDNRSTTFHQARTLLGQKLAPPVKPTGPINPAIWYGIGAFFLIIFGATTCPFIVIIPITLIPVALSLIALAGGAFYANDATVPAWVTYGSIALIIVVAVVIVIVIVAIIVGLTWLIRKIRSGHHHLQTNYATQKEKLAREDLPRWQRAMDRWNNTYYCARDETVFIPGENKAIPADNLKDYLSDPYYRPL